MVTRQTVSEKLLAYLNREITLAELVNWAENFFVGDEDVEPEEDVDLLTDTIMYLAGADTHQFPLTWEVCWDFLNRLGRPVKVVPVDAA